MSKLVVTADYSGVVKEAAKATKENEKAAKAAGSIGREGQKARKPMQDMSTNAENMTKGFGRALFRVEMIKKALSAAGAAATRIADSAIGGARSQREEALSLATSLQAAGATDSLGIAKGAMSVEGGLATPAQLQAFTQGLAGTGRAFSDEDLRRLVTAFAESGELAFGAAGADITSLLSRGASVSGALSGAVRRKTGLEGLLNSDEANAQRELNRLARETQATQAGGFGGQLEIGRAQDQLDKARSPGYNILSEYLDIATRGLFGTAGAMDRAREAPQVDGMRRLADTLAENNSLQRRQRRPALGAQGESAP